MCAENRLAEINLSTLAVSAARASRQVEFPLEPGILVMVLEGRRIAPGASPGRKVRTPQGAMLRNPGSFGRDTRRRHVSRRVDGQCHRKQTAGRKSGDGEKVRP